MPSTNILDGPSLRVLTRDGESRVIGVADLIDNPDDYLSLDGYTPMAETAIIIMLSALVARAVNEEDSESSAEEKYRLTNTDRAAVAGMVRSHLDSLPSSVFEMDPAKTNTPFMQSHVEIPVKTPNVYALKDYGSEPFEVSAPLHVVLGNMLSNNFYSLQGITTPAVGNPCVGNKRDKDGNHLPAVTGGKLYGTPAAPCAVHQVILLNRPCLFDTLCANVSLSMLSDDAGVPVWEHPLDERPDVYGTGGAEISTALHYLTAQYRMMRVTFDEDGSAISAISVNGVVPPIEGTDGTRNLTIEFSPYAVTVTSKDTVKLINSPPSGGLSDTKSFLLEPDKNSKLTLPPVLADIPLLAEFSDKQTLDEVFSRTTVRILSKSTDSAFAKYEDVSLVEASFDLRILDIPESSDVLVNAIQTSVDTRRAYMRSVRNTSRGIDVVETDSFNRFEELISVKLREFIANLNAESDFAKEDERWGEILTSVAVEAIDSYVSELPKSSLRIPSSWEFQPVASSKAKFIGYVKSLSKKKEVNENDQS